MKEFLGEMVGGPAAGTPLGKAQELMYQAFGTTDPEERLKLARQALDLSPDCADAYVLLAEHAKSRKEALDLFEKGVAAGERALGPGAFRDDVGHFWGLLETRPYMRAREGLASKLWTMGRRDEAIRHLQDMLRLNPGDNQGVRYTLAGWLLAEGRDEELARLLEEYDEGSAFWAYTKALVAFRRHGDTPETRKLLKVAKKANKHVPAYLLGRKPLPQERPGYYSPGDRERGDPLRGQRPERLEGDTGGDRLAEGGGTRDKDETNRGPQGSGTDSSGQEATATPPASLRCLAGGFPPDSRPGSRTGASDINPGS